MRCRGLNGSGDCSRRADDEEHGYGLRHRGRKLVIKGMKRYVRIRTGWRKPERKAASNTGIVAGEDTPGCQPSRFRHLPPPDLLDHLPSLPLQTSDFEPWINELWDDFCVEPTPYLVACSMTYLCFILLIGQYFELWWRVVCFVLRLFVPWDDEDGLWVMSFSI